ncbi:phage tail fiber protein [Selenomonas noxia]|uniref:phage tail fiber domain-containing protein n=1 Tax=Selenomonas noxia TaxID=135083 RepID=UPI0032BFBC5C
MQNKATVFYKGGKETYTFPFPYLSKQFVKVRYDQGNTSTPLMYNKDYTVEGQTVKLTTAGSEQATICIYRQTPTGSLVDFNDGSILLASELDKMSVQLLHVAEENNDAIFLSGMFTDDGAWQAGGKRIKNVAAPSAPSDAVNLEYLDGVGVVRADELRRIEKNISAIAEDVERDRNITAVNSNGAAISEQNAKQSEVNAKTSETLVRGMQHAAAQYTDTTRQLSEEARDFRDAAEVAANTAQQAAQGAHTSATNADASAAAAAESAKKAAASAGLDGLVKTENIADGAVTFQKLNPMTTAALELAPIKRMRTTTSTNPIDLEFPLEGNSKVQVGNKPAYFDKIKVNTAAALPPVGVPQANIYLIEVLSKGIGSYTIPLYYTFAARVFNALCYLKGSIVIFDGTASSLLTFARDGSEYVQLTLHTTGQQHLIQRILGITF